MGKIAQRFTGSVMSSVVADHFSIGREIRIVSAVSASLLLIAYLVGDWLVGAALVVLWGGWYFLRDKTGPPVLALAFTHQWMLITIAIFYQTLTGRRVRTMDFVDYRPMV